MNSLTLQAQSGATPITRSQLEKFIGQSAVDAGERRFEMICRGPWSICTSITGLAVSAEWESLPWGNHVKTYTLHGDRTMSRPQESGYAMEGRVSVDGKKHRAFTSSVMFKLEDGKLVNVACLHVCND